MGTYELIDHTADIGIKVKGKDLESLFVDSAWAMFDVIARPLKPCRKAKAKTFPIELKEESTDELFIGWLRELLSLADCEDVIFTEFKIDKISETQLQARVKGVGRRHFHIIREVKAVTYHELRVEREGKVFRRKVPEWGAEVIFDV